jgi:hypothetical protein
MTTVVYDRDRYHPAVFVGFRARRIQRCLHIIHLKRDPRLHLELSRFNCVDTLRG